MQPERQADLRRRHQPAAAAGRRRCHAHDHLSGQLHQAEQPATALQHWPGTTYGCHRASATTATAAAARLHATKPASRRYDAAAAAAAAGRHTFAAQAAASGCSRASAAAWATCGQQRRRRGRRHCSRQQAAAQPSWLQSQPCYCVHREPRTPAHSGAQGGDRRRRRCSRPCPSARWRGYSRGAGSGCRGSAWAGCCDGCKQRRCAHACCCQR